MGKDCLCQEISKGEEGESSCEAWIQDPEGQVWSCQVQEDTQEQEGWIYRRRRVNFLGANGLFDRIIKKSSFPD